MQRSVRLGLKQLLNGVSCRHQVKAEAEAVFGEEEAEPSKEAVDDMAFSLSALKVVFCCPCGLLHCSCSCFNMIWIWSFKAALQWDSV